MTTDRDLPDRLLAALAPRRFRRIACLTEETVEVLYRLGAGDLVCGVSVYARRPAEVRSKPKISAFIKADFHKIEAVNPDLVLCFSDLQRDIASECARRGLEVVVFNQRSISEILGMVLTLGALVDRPERARELVCELSDALKAASRAARELPMRPKVYFEEWPDPLISGIRWVSELIEIAGGQDVFAELQEAKAAPDRVVEAREVVRRNPDLILASWCGKRVKRQEICARPGWEAITAVRTGSVHEIDSTIILQPGPAALTDGLAAVVRRVTEAARRVR